MVLRSLVFMQSTDKGAHDPASCAIMGSTTGMVASCPTLEVDLVHSPVAQCVRVSKYAVSFVSALCSLGMLGSWRCVFGPIICYLPLIPSSCCCSIVMLLLNMHEDLLKTLRVSCA